MALTARQVVDRLLGDAPLVGWNITDVRASSGIRVTLSGPAADTVLIFRPAGQPGFFSTPRLSVMLLGTSTPAHRTLLDHVRGRLERALPAFVPGELEAALEQSASRLAPVQATQLAARSHRPREVELRLNLVCNQACFFCNCDGFAPNTIPAASAAIEAARQLGRQGVESVTVTGGEPTLNQALLEVIRAAREGGVGNVMVQTNAVRLAEPGFAASLRDAGVNRLFVSLHSQHAEVSDRITRVAGTHALTVRGIDAALACELEVITNFVITSLNLAEPPSYVAWQRERFAGALSGRVFSFMAPVAAALKSLSLMPRIADALPPLRAALDDCQRRQEWVRVSGVCGLPLCVLGGYEALSDETGNPPGVPLADDRMKLEGCKQCAHDRKCSGVWKRYVDQHGASEFVPVTHDQ